MIYKTLNTYAENPDSWWTIEALMKNPNLPSHTREIFNQYINLRKGVSFNHVNTVEQFFLQHSSWFNDKALFFMSNHSSNPDVLNSILTHYFGDRKDTIISNLINNKATSVDTLRKILNYTDNENIKKRIKKNPKIKKQDREIRKAETNTWGNCFGMLFGIVFWPALIVGGAYLLIFIIQNLL